LSGERDENDGADSHQWVAEQADGADRSHFTRCQPAAPAAAAERPAVRHYVDASVTELENLIFASFSRQGLMATLGAELVHVAPGEVHIALRPRPELSQQHGYIHAGALTSIVDSACGYAALTVAPSGCEVLTVEFKVNFMRPASADRFVAIGKIVKAGKTLVVCQGEVAGERDSRRECVALMQATIINVAGSA
jgi:uncharacterized protein (TIGR00369 family)